MSFGCGSSKKTTDTSQQSQTEPWAPTIPYLTSLLGDLDSARSTLGPSKDQLDAYAQLKTNAAQGNPLVPDLQQLAKDTINLPSQSGTVTDAYSRLESQLGDVAAGKNLDILSNPQIQAMLTQVGNDAYNRIAGAFAGAGRDITGNAAGQKAIGAGITSAQLPLLLSQYNTEEGRTDAARQALYNAGVTTGQTVQGLDTSALTTRATAPTVENAALAARDYAPNTILNLDQQLKQMPFEDLSLLASLLLPIAGLGGQSAGTGTSTTSGTSSGINLSLGDIGKLGSAALALF
jgi:hypothetical protein